MIIIPSIYAIKNNNERINRAKKGISNVKRMLIESDEIKEYNQKEDIRIEYAYQISDIIGLLLGILYFLNNASLF